MPRQARLIPLRPFADDIEPTLKRESKQIETTPQTRFEIAAAQAMARHSPAEWALLEPRKRTDEIYAELRKLDAEFNRKQNPDRLR